VYEVNGIPLDNPTYGWSLLRRTQLLTSVTKSLTNITIPGRNGVLSGVPTFAGSPIATLVIRSPGEHLETLYALFTQNGGVGYLALEADSTRQAMFELASIDAQGILWEDSVATVTIGVRFPGGCWRDVDLTTVAPADVDTASTIWDVFSGIGADIEDANIVVLGNFGNFQLTDSGSGSWVKTVTAWPHVAGTGLLYVGATGQAFRVNDSAPWTPVSDMSGYVDVSGGGGFRISPFLPTGEPNNRVGRLTLVVTNTSGVDFGVRGRNAYALRNGEV